VVALAIQGDARTVFRPWRRRWWPVWRFGRSLADAIRHREADGRPILTPRERAILTLAAQGRTTRQIAARLCVQPATVKAHLQTLYRKLGVSDRTSAVALALRRGLLKWPPARGGRPDRGRTAEPATAHGRPQLRRPASRQRPGVLVLAASPDFLRVVADILTVA
jgi:DNA-binding CsgD family transcriptional regulator